VDFTEDPDHRLLHQAVREVCARFPDEYWAERDESHTFPWEFYAAMAKGGWIGIAIPAGYGGGGRGITEASIVLEEVAASGACMNGASSIHLSIFGMHPVVRHGSEELKQRYLPRVAAGDLHVACRPIGQNQGIAFPLAEAHTRLGAAELTIRHASWRIDQGLSAGEQANLAKFLAAEAGFAAADAAVQTHGGFGYATEYHVERYWREARLLKIAPIPQEMILNYLAEHVLGLPRSY